MATHGLIELSHGDKARTLVHRFHDGYVDKMINDLITLPFYYYQRLIQTEVSPDIIGKELRPIKQMELSMSNKLGYFGHLIKEKNLSYSEIVKLWSSVGYLDDIRYSLGQLLIGAYPFSYEIAIEPFELYGHIETDADIVVNFTKDMMPDMEIVFPELNEEDLDDEEEAIVSDISDLNSLIHFTENKIKIIDNKITMNIEKIICDLLYSANTKPNIVTKLINKLTK